MFPFTPGLKLRLASGVFAGLAIFLAVAWAIHAIRDNAVQAERARIEQANAAARNNADEAERDVLSCPAGKWNRETSRCAP